MTKKWVLFLENDGIFAFEWKKCIEKQKETQKMWKSGRKICRLIYFVFFCRWSRMNHRMNSTCTTPATR